VIAFRTRIAIAEPLRGRVGAALKGVRGGAERRRGVRVGIETSEGRAERNARRERKSLRNGVHVANAVAWGPV
jgi:hypothetical protein